MKFEPPKKILTTDEFLKHLNKLSTNIKTPLNKVTIFLLISKSLLDQSYKISTKVLIEEDMEYFDKNTSLISVTGHLEDVKSFKHQIIRFEKSIPDYVTGEYILVEAVDSKKKRFVEEKSGATIRRLEGKKCVVYGERAQVMYAYSLLQGDGLD